MGEEPLSEVGDDPGEVVEVEFDACERAGPVEVGRGRSCRIELVQVPAEPADYAGPFSDEVLAVATRRRISRWAPSRWAAGRSGSRRAARAIARASMGRTCRTCGRCPEHGISASEAPARPVRRLRGGPFPIVRSGAGSPRSPRAGSDHHAFSPMPAARDGRC